MRIGTIGYSTMNGLGYQVKSYVKHLPITKVMEVDLSPLNGSMQHGWYPDAQKVKGYPTETDLNEFLTDIDVVLLAETPLNYDLYRIARERNIKTAVVINWEFFDHILKPELPLPDLFIMPSVWHFEDMQAFANQHGKLCIQLHHPVDRQEIPFRLRTGHTALHIAGNPATNDRNGTWDFINTCPDGTVTVQDNDLAYHLRRQYRHSTIHSDIKDQNFMYSLGDFMVLPRKYGGNCLPLNEALSSGMPVIMPDISPNSHLLPQEWLIPATRTDYFEPRTRIDIYSTNLDALNSKIRWFKTCDIEKESNKANQIADTISWETLKLEYLRTLASL